MSEPQSKTNGPRIALAHDYLTQYGGAEKVLEVLCEIWPEAPIHTLFFDAKKLPMFEHRNVQTTFMQKLPRIKSRFQWYLSLMPMATESLDFSAYDIVISSTSAFFKGIITRPDAVHICYCHTPTRHLWTDSKQYVEDLKRVPKLLKQLVLPSVLSRMRMWDRLSADRVDHFISNSDTVRRRIQKYYRKDSTIINPPVETERFAISDKPKNYFLTGGRLVAYKRFDLVIEACNRLNLPLKIFGSGPVEADLRKIAKSSIEFIGKVSDAEKAELYANAKAFINPQEEDFGITPVESMAAGRPVIAWCRGGTTEVVKEGITGAFFGEQTWEALADTLMKFDTFHFDPVRIREEAQRYSKERFKKELKEFVDAKWHEHQRIYEHCG